MNMSLGHSDRCRRHSSHDGLFPESEPSLGSTVLQQLHLLHDRLNSIYVSQKRMESRVDQIKHEFSELRVSNFMIPKTNRGSSRLSSRRTSETSIRECKRPSSRKSSDSSILLPVLLKSDTLLPSRDLDPDLVKNKGGDIADLEPSTPQSVNVELCASQYRYSSCANGEEKELAYDRRHHGLIMHTSWKERESVPTLKKTSSSRSIISDSQIRKIQELRKLKSDSEAMFPLRPDSELKLLFDAISMFVLLSDSIMVPYIIAWEKNLEGISRLFAWIALGFWTFDIGLNFATCFTEHDVCVRSWKRIACHYLKGWFAFDVFVLSFDWITLVVDMLADNERMAPIWVKIVRLLKAGRMVRIIEMMRIGRFAHINEIVLQKARRLGAEANVRLTLRLSKMVALILWICHAGSCLWYRLMMKQMFMSDTCLEWSQYFHDLYSEEGKCVLEDTLLSEQFYYLMGLYWSVTSMFSGGSYLSPTNSAEALFSVAFVVFGMLFTSTVISSLAASLIDFQMMRREQTIKIRTLQQYLHQHKIHPSLCVNVQNQIRQRLMVERRLTDKDVPVISLLSSELRSQLRCGLCAPWLQSHPLIGPCSFLYEGLIKNMCKSCVTHTAMNPGEELFIDGTPVVHVYLLISGSMFYFFEDSYLRLAWQSIHTSTSDFADAGGVEKVVGPQWLCEIAMWANWRAVGSLEATDSCELLSVEVAAFVEAIATAPLVKMIMADYAKALLEFIQLERPPDFDDINLGVEHDYIVASMNVRSTVALSQPGLESLKGRPDFVNFRNSERRKCLMDLESEVNEGVCHVIHDSNGNVMRAVQVVAVQLMQQDGRMLVQLGAWEDERPVPRSDYFLPCTKRRISEHSKMSASRLFGDEFLHPSFQFNLHFSQLENEITSSAAYGVPTKYLRTIFHGTISRSHEANVQTQTFPHPTLHEEGIEVFVVEGLKSDEFTAGEKSLKLCAWLFPHALDALAKYAADKRSNLIHQWMDTLMAGSPEVCPDSLGTATEGFAHGTRTSSHPRFRYVSEV